MMGDKPKSYVTMLREIRNALRTGFQKAGYDGSSVMFGTNLVGQSCVLVKDSPIYISVRDTVSLGEPGIHLDIRKELAFVWKMSDDPGAVVYDIITWYKIWYDNEIRTPSSNISRTTDIPPWDDIPVSNECPDEYPTEFLEEDTKGLEELYRNQDNSLKNYTPTLYELYLESQMAS